MKHILSFRPSFVGTLLLVSTVLGGSTLFGGRAFAQTGSSAEGDGLAVAIALESALTKAIAQTEPSVVSIARFKATDSDTRFSERPARFGFELRRPQNPDTRRPESPDFIPSDFGAGIVIAPSWNREERFVLTNYHVVRGGPVEGRAGETAYELYVRFHDRRGARATIVAADPRSDLAVLKVERKPAEMKPIPFPEATEFRKGQLVVSLGNPYAIGRDGAASASWGMISNIGRRPGRLDALLDDSSKSRRQTIHQLGTLIHVDTRLNLGTSGGPLLNLRGELIGITTSLAALDGYEKSAGYAIPLDQYVRRIIDDLTRGYEVEYGLLGISPVDKTAEEIQAEFPSARLTGAAMAGDVYANSPAAQAGLLPKDLIVGINNEPVHSRFDLMRLVGLIGPDSTAILKVWRERPVHEFVTIPVKLGKWPVADDEGIIATSQRYPKWRGLSVDFCTGRERYMSDTLRYFRAVVVTDTPSPGEPGADQKLRKGDLISHVNDIPVSTPAEFHKAVDKLTGPVKLRLIDDRKVEIPPQR